MDESDPQNVQTSGEQTNPYTPAANLDTLEAVSEPLGFRPLSWQYVTVLVALILTLAFLCAFVAGLAVPALLSVIVGAVRVPIMRRKLAVKYPAVSLPNEFTQLAVSSVFAFIGGIVSIVAFMVVCVPGAVVLNTISTSGSGADIGIFVLMGLSVIIAIVSFVGLFLMSLKLSI